MVTWLYGLKPGGERVVFDKPVTVRVLREIGADVFLFSYRDGIVAAARGDRDGRTWDKEQFFNHRFVVFVVRLNVI
jgi:hypothetical protein